MSQNSLNVAPVEGYSGSASGVKDSRRKPDDDQDSHSDDEQINSIPDHIYTSTLLEIEQILKPTPPGDNGYPITWTIADGEGQHGEGHFQLVTLDDEDCFQYDVIANEFDAVGLRVTAIERVENTVLWDKFRTEKKHMSKNRPTDFNLNECYLYHGTTASKDTISEEGLDMRLSRLGHFGKGTYFSDNPLKCLQYAHSGTPTDKPYILKCRVLLGDVKIYPDRKRDTKLKREPKKETATGQWKYYDSIKGRPKDFNEFVIYENRRALIEYIVTYEPKEEVRSLVTRQDDLLQNVAESSRSSSPKPAQRGTDNLGQNVGEDDGSDSEYEASADNLGKRRPSLEQLAKLGLTRDEATLSNDADSVSSDNEDGDNSQSCHSGRESVRSSSNSIDDAELYGVVPDELETVDGGAARWPSVEEAGDEEPQQGTSLDLTMDNKPGSLTSQQPKRKLELDQNDPQMAMLKQALWAIIKKSDNPWQDQNVKTLLESFQDTYGRTFKIEEFFGMAPNSGPNQSKSASQDLRSTSTTQIEAASVPKDGDSIVADTSNPVDDAYQQLIQQFQTFTSTNDVKLAKHYLEMASGLPEAIDLYYDTCNNLQ